MTDLVRIERALLSTSDKTGLASFASALHTAGTELLASGGTALHLRAAGLTVADVGTLTGRGAAFGGRLKTLSFEVAAALLFDRERDAAEARAEGVQPIDLVAVNLYPFASAAGRGASADELVNLIDIGGPTMIRAAAKNHRFVTVVTNETDYAEVLAEIARLGGTSLALRTRLAQRAFATTAAYEAAIARSFAAQTDAPALYEARDRAQSLRYGENPHQTARVFSPSRPSDALEFEQRGGKELSFNNYVDLQAALEAVVDLPGPAVAVVKHENPCGLALAADVRTALELAWAGDPVSAFGSVIACNRALTLTDVTFLGLDDPRKEARKFVEIVAAPGFSDEALAYLAQQRSLRTLIVDPASGRSATERRSVRGLILEQARDQAVDEPLTVVVSGPHEKANELDEELVRFGLVAVRQLKSNAIALVARTAGGACHLVGMGAGQPNRRASSELALRTARANGVADFAGIVLVSDAFFPFADGVELALAAGIRTVIEPGGSIRDDDVKTACEAHGATLVFTGRRHFRH
jgi:phosphoribosylaminoimidazolecarboxamide formyltransferase / IMP cyclohydrolase